jgi:acyl dehydratase
MTEPDRYRLRAHNTATASANKIHDDAVARRLGFRGGLVPGVDVYAYLCHLPARRWGMAWLERGTIDVRLAAPVYDGDQVEVAATPRPDGGMDLVLVDPDGQPCATGWAACPEAADPAPSASDWPSAPAPEHPPAATAESLVAEPFGSIWATFDAQQAPTYLDDVRETLDLYRQEQVAHPGWLLRYANYVITANVTMGPWIHVSSAVTLLGAVRDGDTVETRARVIDVFERAGHGFVELDVLQVVGDRPVARVDHTAIYRPRGT